MGYILPILVMNCMLQLENVEAFNNQRVRKYSDQLDFPQEYGYHYQIEQLYRIQRAINGRSKEQSINRIPLPPNSQPMIFFDEDDTEPLAPEPKFDIRMGRPPPTSPSKPGVTSTPISTSMTPASSPIPRWPPMPPMPISSNPGKLLMPKPPVSKVTFFPTTATKRPIPSPPPLGGPGADKVVTPGKKTTPTKISQQGKTTTPKKPITAPITTTPKTIPIVEEKVRESDEIHLLDGSFYVPFIKSQNKESKTRNN